MKIFAFTDVHANSYALKRIKNKVLNEKPDLLICCGDISLFGNGLDISAKIINSFGIKTLIIPGNHESVEEIILLCKKYKNFINLHKKYFVLNGVLFFGFGTGGFSFIEKELENIIPEVKIKAHNFEKFVFVTHAPIYKTKLDYLFNAHRGCKSSRKLIMNVDTDICFCGHFHENERKNDKIKKCLIINPGKFGMIIKI